MGRYDYEPGSVFGIVLLPEAAASERCCEYSATLGALSKSEIALGRKTVLPHATLIHARGDRGAARRIWETVRPQLPESVEIEAIGLDLHASEQGTVPAIALIPEPSILRAHTAAVDAATAAGHEILSEHGDRFWPHITLAWWPAPPRDFVPLPPLLSDRFVATPHLVEMGRHGTVVARL